MINDIFIYFLTFIIILYILIHRFGQCNNRLRVTYGILSLSILYLFLILRNLTPYSKKINDNMIFIFILSIIFIFATIFTKLNSISQIISFGILITLITLSIYPLYSIGKVKNVIEPVLATTICIFISLSLVSYLYPNFISLSWEKYILIGLFSLICFRIMLYFFSSNNLSLIRLSSYLGILLFSFIVLYDTKYLMIQAKNCNLPYNYLQNILSLFLDFINMFSDLLTLNVINN